LKALQSTLHEPQRDKVTILVTDVGLPGGLNGRQLADAVRAVVPDLPVLLITGYGGGAFEKNGQLEPGMAILPKPFAMDALAERVRSMIEQPA
jgi:DNA-binding response OmpR family regulator